MNFRRAHSNVASLILHSIHFIITFQSTYSNFKNKRFLSISHRSLAKLYKDYSHYTYTLWNSSRRYTVCAKSIIMHIVERPRCPSRARGRERERNTLTLGLSTSSPARIRAFPRESLVYHLSLALQQQPLILVAAASFFLSLSLKKTFYSLFIITIRIPPVGQ